MRFALTILTLACLAPAAAADPPDLMNLARTHYEAGRALYQLGKYEQAVVEFEEGYRLAPRPSFLVNLAQAYRQLGRVDQARAMYEKFLAAAPMDDPMRADVKQILATLPHAAAPPGPAPSATLAPTPAPVSIVDTRRRPWHRDPAGGVLLASGLAAIVAGAVMLGVSSDRTSHARDTYGDFLAAQDASGLQIAGAVVLASGALLGVGAAVRYRVVHRLGLRF
jgi:tetratricopeptide (TPR) repeat protein